MKLRRRAYLARAGGAGGGGDGEGKGEEEEGEKGDFGNFHGLGFWGGGEERVRVLGGEGGRVSGGGDYSEQGEES